jgi:hypothetical protein
MKTIGMSHRRGVPEQCIPTMTSDRGTALPCTLRLAARAILMHTRPLLRRCVRYQMPTFLIALSGYSYLWIYDLYGPVGMLLMRANPLPGQVGGSWALEIETIWALNGLA